MVLEKPLESYLDSKEIKPVNPKGNQPWIFIWSTDDETEAPILWPTDMKSWLIGKYLNARKDWRQRRRKQQRMRWFDSIVDSMDVNLSKFGERVKDREAWSPWDCKKSDMTEWLNNNRTDINNIISVFHSLLSFIWMALYLYNSIVSIIKPEDFTLYIWEYKPKWREECDKTAWCVCYERWRCWLNSFHFLDYFWLNFLDR